MAALVDAATSQPEPTIVLTTAEDVTVQLETIQDVLDKMVETRAQWTTAEALAYDELTAREVELLAIQSGTTNR